MSFGIPEQPNSEIDSFLVNWNIQSPHNAGYESEADMDRRLGQASELVAAEAADGVVIRRTRL